MYHTHYTLLEWFSKNHSTYKNNNILLNRIRLAVDLVKFIQINHKRGFLHNGLNAGTISVCKIDKLYHFVIYSCEESEYLSSDHLDITSPNSDSIALANILLTLVLPEMNNSENSNLILRTDKEMGLKKLSMRGSLVNLMNNIQHFKENFIEILQKRQNKKLE